MDSLDKKLRLTFRTMYGAGTGSAGAGLGFLARSRYEDRFKPDKEKTTGDKLLAKAPVLGALTGFGAGFFRGKHHAKTLVDSLSKFGALKKDVELRPHQLDLIDQVHKNNGQMLVAHATGVGKTLGAIAAFEDLKQKGKASKAIVVVPSSLRSNFVDSGIKKFTNSSVSTFGPKNESGTKNVGHHSAATYNVISYDLFREHGKEIIDKLKPDTLIMDEVHRARATEGVTYNKLMDLRPHFKNVLTLTGSVVNNDPNEIVPLLDITYGRTGHRLVNTKFFDKLFVNKQAKTVGFIQPKTVIEKSLKNKPQLSKYLEGKVSYVPHEDVEKLLPKKSMEVVRVPMSKRQHELYDFSMSSVDPLTRWKIRNNLPVGQKEAQEAFGKLMQARQVATDPSVLDKELQKLPDPAAFSPKIKRIVDDLQSHLDAGKDNKSVIYGNLLEGQLKAVEKSLKHKGIDYTTFYGVGNEGNSAKARKQNIENFQKGDHRVLLISGAGAEGLDLKNANMLQVVEGHYNPERIHQAESRVRRLGSPVKEVQIKRYVSTPSGSKAGSYLKDLLSKTPVGGNTGVDEWIYTIAGKKEKLNASFRDVLNNRGVDKTAGFNVNDSDDRAFAGHLLGSQAPVAGQYGMIFGRAFGRPIANLMARQTDKALETKAKQILLDMGHENLATKQHFPKIMAESKLDEKALDASMGMAALAGGAGLMYSLNPSAHKLVDKYVAAPLGNQLQKYLAKRPIVPYGGKASDKARMLLHAASSTPGGRKLIATGLVGIGMGLAGPILGAYVTRKVLNSSLKTDNPDLKKGIDIYKEKLRKKYESKYKTSKGFVNEFETKKELGIDVID